MLRLGMCHDCRLLVTDIEVALAAGVSVDGERVPCDTVVVAMGPWSSQARAWLPGIPSFSGQKAHSIIVEPTSPIGANCLFMNHHNKSGAPSALKHCWYSLGILGSCA